MLESNINIAPEVEQPACAEIKILRRVRAEPSRRPPRHRRDACSMVWRCRFLTARPSQDGRVIAGHPSHWLISTQVKMSMNEINASRRLREAAKEKAEAAAKGDAFIQWLESQDKFTLCGNQILRRVRAESSRRPPRHRRDTCSTAWGCRFPTARTSQDGRVIAEK